MTDDARRDRVADAIRDAFHQSGDLFVKFPLEAARPFDDIADAAIAAMNEPEPTPRLLTDMAKAMYNQDGLGTCWEVKSYDSQRLYVDTARAALGVVLRKMVQRWANVHVYNVELGIAECLGIPESLVIELLDGE